MWSVIGAISQATSLPVTTGVTCPTVRIHPAIIAQAAATSAVLLEGRFNLGVGSGEALNEHILGDRWPEADVRLEMLEEAVEVIRTLWRGRPVQPPRAPLHRRERARLRPARRAAADPRLGLRAQGDQARGPHRRRLLHHVAGQGGHRHLYRSEGGNGPVHAGTKVCFMADEDEARASRPHRLWPNEALPGELAQVLPTPAHFEQACELVEPEMLVTPVGPVGPRCSTPPRPREAPGVAAPVRRRGRRRALRQQLGPEGDAFFDTWAREVLPRFA